MAKPLTFPPGKLICGIISSQPRFIERGREMLVKLYGEVDLESPCFNFDSTDYYKKQMGCSLTRKFFSFVQLLPAEQLAEIKLQTNRLEEDIRKKMGMDIRIVNIDPGFLNASSLIMATAKNFAHRIPLQGGIYAHLELLFGKKHVKTLDWTYPDFRKSEYHDYFLEVREIYLAQLKKD